LWKNPIERIATISTTDELLVKEIGLEEKQFLPQAAPGMADEEHPDGVEGGKGGKGGDNGSEYSAITKYSLQSIQSKRSNRTALSLQSLNSSILSAGNHSSVTILSSLSQQQQHNRYGGGGGVGGSGASEFSIQGIDHALLSRGKISDVNYTSQSTGKTYAKGRDLKPKDLRRIEKEKKKGVHYDRNKHDPNTVKDIHGLKKENNFCEELMNYINLRPIIHLVNDLIGLLLFASGGGNSGGNVSAVAAAAAGGEVSYAKRQSAYGSEVTEARLFVIELMKSLQLYIHQIQSAQLPYAPIYPLQWLIKRNLKNIVFFQNYFLLYEKRLLQKHVAYSREYGVNFMKLIDENMLSVLIEQAKSGGNGCGGVSSEGVGGAGGGGMAEGRLYYVENVLMEGNDLIALQLLTKNWWKLCFDGIAYYYKHFQYVHLLDNNEADGKKK
jgi:hypothetical protein